MNRPHRPMQDPAVASRGGRRRRGAHSIRDALPQNECEQLTPAEGFGGRRSSRSPGRSRSGSRSNSKDIVGLGSEGSVPRARMPGATDR